MNVKTYAVVLMMCLLPFAAMGKQEDTEKLSAKERGQLIVYLARNVIWPIHAGPEIKLCISGRYDSADFDFLNKVRIGDKLLRVLPYSKKQVGDCHMIYVPQAGAYDGSIELILKQSKQLPLLTISEIADFEKQGGTISIFKANKKPALSLNMNDLHDRNLQLSEEVLKNYYVFPKLDEEEQDMQDE